MCHLRALVVLAIGPFLTATMLGVSGLAAEEPPTPVIPNPSRCHVTGRTPQELQALREFVDARGPTSPVSFGIDKLPEGPPADSATRAAITALVDEFFACVAAGQPDRGSLLLSDAYLVRYVDDPDEAVAVVAGLANSTPVPDPPGELAIYAGPWDVRALPDGRVSAAVWLNSEDEHPAPGVTAIWLFVFEGGEWRMDGTITNLSSFSEATPSTAKKKKQQTRSQVNVAEIVGWPDVAPWEATPIP